MNKRKKIQFWGKDANDDTLVCQIIAGLKTATCCPTRYFMDTCDGYHEAGFDAGEEVEVYDLQHRRRCVILIKEVYETTLENAPDKLWQGETNASLREFQDEHLACWKELEASLDMPITASHFALLDVIDMK